MSLALKAAFSSSRFTSQQISLWACSETVKTTESWDVSNMESGQIEDAGQEEIQSDYLKSLVSGSGDHNNVSLVICCPRLIGYRYMPLMR